MKEAMPFILFTCQLVIYAVIFFIQRSQLKSIKEKFAATEKFMSIFDLDTVKDYVSMSTEKERIKAYIEVKRDYQNHEAKIGKEYNELFTIVACMIAAFPKKEDREIFLNENMPFTGERMKELVFGSNVSELDENLADKLNDYLRGN